jgi:FKBP-type peptidyl-prolyl cis-trans isomerase (trigger factor)
MKTKVERKPHAVAVVEGTLSVDEIEKAFPAAVERVVASVEIQGFRKGKAPKERVMAEFGEKAVWREAAEAALREHIADILKEHELSPILPPEISLTASEPHTEVPFTITVVLQPRLEIKNYIEKAAEALKKLEKLNQDEELKKARESLDAQVRAMLQKTDDAPLTDDQAKMVGFENVIALNFFLGTEAERAVENYENQRKRGAVAEKLIADSSFEIPEVIIAEEARTMLESAKQEIARTMPFNEYLQKRGITEQALLEEFTPQAEKRVALDMLFAHIAKDKELKPDEEETHRVAHALMHQGAPEQEAHRYGAEVSLRERVWEVLGVSTPKLKKEEKAEESHDHKHDHHEHGHKHDHDHDGRGHTH